MDESTARSDEEAPSLWSYVPVEEHVSPDDEVAQRIRARLADLWSAMFDDDAPEKADVGDVEPCPDECLNRVAPEPDWRDAVPALNEALNPKPGTSAMPTVVVGAPHSGHAATLRAWARERDWRLVDPPAPDSIFARKTETLAAIERGDAPWVLPRLERCYLRHRRGLGLVRELLDAYNDEALGRGIIGCSNWAWTYLQHVWPGRIERVLTPQSFEVDRLIRWFRQLAGEESPFARTFLAFDDATEASSSSQATSETRGVRPFLSHLATYSRGIPGVAWSLWRRSLIQNPEPLSSKSSDVDDPETLECIAGAYTWSQFEPPSMPGKAGRDEWFVLHTLLLHGGLTADLLDRLLPLSPHAIRHVLHALEDAELLARGNDDVWTVTPPGYPAVRRSLRNNDYLVGTP